MVELLGSYVLHPFLLVERELLPSSRFVSNVWADLVGRSLWSFGGNWRPSLLLSRLAGWTEVEGETVSGSACGAQRKIGSQSFGHQMILCGIRFWESVRSSVFAASLWLRFPRMHERPASKKGKIKTKKHACGRTMREDKPTKAGKSIWNRRIAMPQKHRKKLKE